jgi:hypothetical protein
MRIESAADDRERPRHSLGELRVSLESDLAIQRQANNGGAGIVLQRLIERRIIAGLDIGTDLVRIQRRFRYRAHPRRCCPRQCGTRYTGQGHGLRQPPMLLSGSAIGFDRQLGQIAELRHVVPPAAGGALHLTTGLPRHHFNLVGTACAGQQKGFFLAAHDLDSAKGPFHRSTQSFSRRFLLPFRGIRLESRLFSSKNLLAFLVWQGHNLEPSGRPPP